MWMAGENTPSDLFFDVVSMRLGVKLHDIGGLGLHATKHMSGRNDKGVIAPGADPRSVFAAGYRWPEQRPGVVVWPIDVNYGSVRSYRSFLKGESLNGTSDSEECCGKNRDRQKPAVHLSIGPGCGWAMRGHRRGQLSRIAVQLLIDRFSDRGTR